MTRDDDARVIGAEAPRRQRVVDEAYKSSPGGALGAFLGGWARPRLETIRTASAATVQQNAIFDA